ncbi:hypothetical protein [Lysinibacillus sp. NPDC047702]|uniref:hypothetical protein n=1 Tax=unclassified Lysinibacillus TaxID=2636778 RepID=UPI003D079FA9
MLHKFVIHDLAIQSLQRDLTVTTPREDEVLRYANQALKTQVEELLLSHINK